MFQLDQLRTEHERVQLLDDERRTKVRTYHQVSVAIDNKLDDLRSLGNDINSDDCCKSLGVPNFVKRVKEKWKFAEVSIEGNVRTVQLASHTKPSKPS